MIPERKMTEVTAPYFRYSQMNPAELASSKSYAKVRWARVSAFNALSSNDPRLAAPLLTYPVETSPISLIDGHQCVLTRLVKLALFRTSIGTRRLTCCLISSG
jgi:hypothetical protein